MSTSALIGREHPAGVLQAEIDRALASHGGLVLVTGEAGIGKTTLVTAAVREARRQGALVLSGSCWDSGHAPGYWPWVQVVRGLRRGLSEAEYAAAEGAAGGGLAALLGEAAAGRAEPPAGDSDDFRVYDAVTTALVTAAQARPVVVVLDDLHWADAASLRLLEFAAQHTWFERLLLIGTYRDVEVEIDAGGPGPDSSGTDGSTGGTAGHPLRSLLLPLQTKATTVTLAGLGRDEVTTLLARTAGKEPDAELAEQVYHRTGGNPFFVEQAARLWSSGGTALAVTPGVRDVLRRRLSLLPAPVRELLTTAAVLGREFSRPVLAASAAIPAAQVDGLLGQALSGRLVTAHGGGRFSFAHDLFRETLYDSLSEEAARERHAAVVQAAGGTDIPGPAKRLLAPADLARHGYLAGERLSVTQRVKLLQAAADDAHNRFAFEEVLRHLQRALEIAEGADAQALEPATQVIIGLDLASHLCHLRGLAEAAELYRHLVKQARETGDPELLARVALAIYGNPQLGGDMAPLRAEVLIEAHAALVLGGTQEQAPGAASGAEPQHRPDLAQLADELTVHSATLARSSEDDEALAYVLWARHDALWGLGSAAEREALTAELLDTLRRKGDWTMHAVVTSLRWVAKLEQGDPGFYGQYETFLAAVAEYETPHLLMAAHVDRSIISALRGDFQAAEELLAVADLPEVQSSFFGFLSSHQRWAMKSLRGQRMEESELRHELAEAHHPYPEVVLGVSALERGDADAGMRHFATACEKSFSYPRALMPLWLRLRALAAAASADPQLCEQVREQLAPHPDAWLVSFYGCDISGPVSLWLGLVEAAEERWDEAVAAFTTAHRRAELLQAHPWSVLARARLAEALLSRGASGDRERGGVLRGEVDQEAPGLGMTEAVERIRQPRGAGTAGGTAVQPRVPVRVPVLGHGPDAPGGPAAGAALEFRREGSVWQLSFAGRTAHLPDAKGLRDLHQLLSHPGGDVPAVRLLAPDGGDVVVAARQMGGDDILDDEAKAQYKRRLQTLDEEIDRAAERGDAARAAEYDRERQALLAELRAAAGLAGRSRRLGDEAERARKTVTARIRDTLRKLDDRHPELAAHLRATVSTGAHCAYQPERPMAWRL